jgi:hypothetical protein
MFERAWVAEKSIVDVGEPQPMLGEQTQKIAPPRIAEGGERPAHGGGARLAGRTASEA